MRQGLTPAMQIAIMPVSAIDNYAGPRLITHVFNGSVGSLLPTRSFPAPPPMAGFVLRFAGPACVK